MTTLQKAIKYLAIAFAVFLVVSIFSGILGTLGSLGMFFDGNDLPKYVNKQTISGNIESLNVDIAAADFKIFEGKEFAVYTNFEDFKIDEKNGVLSVREETGFFQNYNDVMLQIEVPKGFNFKKADIVTGAGRVNVQCLSADYLALQFGAGEVVFEEIYGNVDAEIESGVGKTIINGGELHDLDFSMGVGEVIFKSRLSGECDIEHGVGKTEITLLGSQDDYKITLENGLGEMRFEEEIIKDKQTFSNGVTDVDIEGGVGKIVVTIAGNS